MNWIALLSQYGYPVVLVGTFLEGETVLIMAGFLAHRGYLDLPVVMLTAFAGTLAGDQLYFFLGRRHGAQFLKKRGLEHAAVRIRRLLAQRALILVVGFRFLYGLRTACPIIIGASGFSPSRYVVFNVLGAAIWSVVIAGAGYLFGQALGLAQFDVKKYEHLVLLFLLAAGVAAGTVIRLRRKHVQPA